MKTIDISAKEYWDKQNGNSYWSAQVTIDFGLPTEKTIYVPFQYGYGDSYVVKSLEQLEKDGLLESETIYHPWTYFKEKNISLRNSIQTGFSERKVKSWGSN